MSSESNVEKFNKTYKSKNIHGSFFSQTFAPMHAHVYVL